jgi:hypothetical protein
MAKTFAVTGGSDATKAIKKIESFGIEDQTPTIGISGPSGSVLTSTTFIATGTANDDKGVNALSFWFRHESNQYLQEDGSVSSNFNFSAPSKRTRRAGRFRCSRSPPSRPRIRYVRGARRSHNVL